MIPSSPGVSISRLSKRSVHVSWQRALQAAKKAWGLDNEHVEAIVRAAVTDESRYVRGWAVVADMISNNPAPGSNTIDDKMVIVVDGHTRKAVYSYPVDPIT